MDGLKKYISGLFILILAAGAAAAEPLVWVTDDTPGGHYIVGGGPELVPEKPGVEIELYRMVAERLGLEVRFKRLPWNHCLHLIEQNRVDGIFPASFKPERMKIGRFPMRDGAPDPDRKTRDTSYFLYKLKTDPLGWDGNQFSNVSWLIGVPKGWSISGDLRERYGFIKEDTIGAGSPNLLVHRRIQGYICLETVFDAYLNQQPERYGNIVKVRPAVSDKHYYLMLSRQFADSRPELAQRIWDTIRAIRTSRGYADLVRSYIE